MQKVLQKSKLFYVLFILIAVFIIGILLFKPVLKWIYPDEYTVYIDKYSEEYALDRFLVMGIISAESGFDPYAESHKQARGLMQIREDTAAWCVEKFEIPAENPDLFDPELNIRIGCAYMNYLLEKYNGNTDTALAAYNAGEGNVSSWLLGENSGSGSGDELYEIPFEETENYVKKVNNRIKIYRFLYE